MNHPRFYYSIFSGNREYDNQDNKVLDLKYIINNLLSEDRLQIIKLKEIAWRNKWIDDEKLIEIATPLLKSGYGEYLLELLKNANSN